MGSIHYKDPTSGKEKELVIENSKHLDGNDSNYYIPHKGTVTIRANQWTYSQDQQEYVTEILTTSLPIDKNMQVNPQWSLELIDFLSLNRGLLIYFSNDNGKIRCYLKKDNKYDKTNIIGDISINIEYYHVL